jgi:hypothetical protein
MQYTNPELRNMNGGMMKTTDSIIIVSLPQKNTYKMTVKTIQHSVQLVTLAGVITATMSCGNAAEAPATTPAADTTTAAPANTTQSDVHELHWLNGWWQNPSKVGIAFEDWKLNDNGTMTGRSGMVVGKDTIASETLVIEQKDNKIYYIPTVKGQNNDQPIPFEMTSAVADSFVFENKEHDFPNRIVYYKLPNNKLTAVIYGTMNGQPASERFELSR